MAGAQDDPIGCIHVDVTWNEELGCYTGTYTTPAEGGFSSTVLCNVLVQGTAPGGDYTPGCSSTYFSCSNIQSNQAQCTEAEPDHPGWAYWNTLSFEPSPTAWTSIQAINVTMTAQ